METLVSAWYCGDLIRCITICVIDTMQYFSVRCYYSASVRTWRCVNDTNSVCCPNPHRIMNILVIWDASVAIWFLQHNFSVHNITQHYCMCVLLGRVPFKAIHFSWPVHNKNNVLILHGHWFNTYSYSLVLWIRRGWEHYVGSLLIPWRLSKKWWWQFPWGVTSRSFCLQGRWLQFLAPQEIEWKWTGGILLRCDKFGRQGAPKGKTDKKCSRAM